MKTCGCKSKKFNRELKTETEHVRTKCRCMQAKLVAYIKDLEAMSQQ